MKERLERALKVFVPPEAAEALETAQLTMTMAEAAPGAAPELAEKLVTAAEAAADPVAAFAAAFAATVAMAEADAARTWAANKKTAQGLLTRLGAVWRGVFATGSAVKAKAKAKAPGGIGLEPECRSALEAYGGAVAAKWGRGRAKRGRRARAHVRLRRGRGVVQGQETRESETSRRRPRRVMYSALIHEIVLPSPAFVRPPTTKRSSSTTTREPQIRARAGASSPAPWGS